MDRRKGVRLALVVIVLAGVLSAALVSAPWASGHGVRGGLAAQLRVSREVGARGHGTGSRPLYGLKLQKYIVKTCRHLHTDAAAALAVALCEGGWYGEVGDGGTSFGPWQLHRGGTLPRRIHNPRRWANSPNGLKYALRGIRRVVGSRVRLAAVKAIVCRFEKCGAPGHEIAKAWRYYGAMRRLVRRLSRG